jgi:hypothetical protein
MVRVAVRRPGYAGAVDRNLIKALLAAWEHPQFRSGLRHLIDLDEITTLLAALSTEDRDRQVERRALELLRSAMDTDEIRRAVLLLVEVDEIRRPVVAGIAEGLADRPGLARSIRSAADDPTVRRELPAALESARVRELIWTAAQGGTRRRWTLIRSAVLLIVGHRHARRLAWALRRHGVLREFRRAQL